MEQNLFFFYNIHSSWQGCLLSLKKKYFIVIKLHCFPPWVITAFCLGYSMQIMLCFQKIAKIIFYLYLQDLSPILPNPSAATSEGQNFSWPADGCLPSWNDKFPLPFLSHPNFHRLLINPLENLKSKYKSKIVNIEHRVNIKPVVNVKLQWIWKL